MTKNKRYSPTHAAAVVNATMFDRSQLPFLDYDAIIANPKIIIGYSDTTALLAGIYAKTGLITFYGPALIPSFGEYPPLVDITYESFIKILTRKQSEIYTYTLPKKWSDERIN